MSSSLVTREELVALALIGRFAPAIDAVKAAVRAAALRGETAATVAILPPANNSAEERDVFVAELQKIYASPIQVTVADGQVTVDWTAPEPEPEPAPAPESA